MSLNNSSFGRVLARLPYDLGHELNDDSVVTISYDRARDQSVIGVASWDDTQGTSYRIAESIAAQSVRATRNSGAATDMFVIGYGPRGALRAGSVAEQITRFGGTPAPVLAHVRGTTWRTRSELSGNWGEPQPLPDYAPEAVGKGQPMPAATRAGVAERYAPLPAAQFGSLAPAVASRLDATPPSLRADIATRALDELAVAGRSDDPDKMATLAHLVNTDTVVRDSVVAHAVTTPERTEALVQSFRAAPSELRPALASAAGAATFLRGSAGSTVSAVLDHAPTEGQHARLGELIRTATRSGMNAHTLRDAVSGAAHGGLESADKEWRADREASARAASFPLRAGASSDRMATARATRTSGRSSGVSVER